MDADLKALDAIPVPPPAPDETYRARANGRDVTFRGLKALLAAADFSKAGDRHAGLAAGSEVDREAARRVLSGLTLQHLFDRPLTGGDGKIDSVMRVNYDIDHAIFARLAGKTVGELKDHLLSAPPDETALAGRGLTGVMAAAVAKLCDVHELIYVARKIARPTKARTTLGLPGTLSSRLQPNHPTDDPRGVTCLVYAGLSLGAGDALLGINPAIDTVDNVAALLRLLAALRERTGVPTQTCVLSHVKTQLACLERGVPVDILFQSLAGTERTNLTEFDLTIDLLDRAYRAMAEQGALAGVAPQWMYFETGQGSEFTYGKHDGTDMTTLEALCYGLARRYDPFMVNNVTGFIGPETHLDSLEMIVANLQDHFMGKLLGLPMGMAPCYTLHSRISLEGQQMATQMLTAAGANYYMDVHLNTDRMLAYFDTSGHDDQTLREIHGRRPAPEYLGWAIGRGILAEDGTGGVTRGPHWGDPGIFCANGAELAALGKVTPALYGFAAAGPRPAESITREVRLHQAIAREAVHSEIDRARLGIEGDLRVVRTRAASRDAHLSSPAMGSELADGPADGLAPETHAAQIVFSDGLSAEALHANLPELFPVLVDGLRARGISFGTPILVPYGRVKIAEPIADALDARVVILLIGERPGGDAAAATSLSAYLVYRLADREARTEAARFSGNDAILFETSVLSNIYPKGLPPAEAGSVIVEKTAQILARRAAGNRLETILRG